MSNLELPGTLKDSPAEDFTQSSLPASLYSQAPPTHSMISGAPVLKVRVDGRTTPTDFLVPSASVMPWLTHLPSKYTLAWVVTLTLSIFSVVMGVLYGCKRCAGQAGGSGPDFRSARSPGLARMNPMRCLGRMNSVDNDVHEPRKPG